MWSHILKLIGKCTDVKQLEIMRKGVIDAYHGAPSLEMISGYVSHSRAGELIAAINKRIEYLNNRIMRLSRLWI